MSTSFSLSADNGHVLCFYLTSGHLDWRGRRGPRSQARPGVLVEGSTATFSWFPWGPVNGKWGTGCAGRGEQAGGIGMQDSRWDPFRTWRLSTPCTCSSCRDNLLDSSRSFCLPMYIEFSLYLQFHWQDLCLKLSCRVFHNRIKLPILPLQPTLYSHAVSLLATYDRKCEIRITLQGYRLHWSSSF